MEAIIALIVQAIGGGAGGNVVGGVAKNLSLGTTGNSIAGAIGGIVLTWVAARIPGLDALLGSAAGAAAAGGIDIGALAGQAVSGLIGGGALTAIIGAIKNATAK